MATVVQAKPEPHGLPSITPVNGSLNPDETVLQGENDLPSSKNATPIINDVESLREGIIKTSRNKTKAPYTILLVGETSVGKSSLLELIANVLAGNDIDHYDLGILDHTNEQRGSNHQSQTNAAHLYERTSTNGIVVRIIDTPGFPDPRRPQLDERHTDRIKTQIKEHIDSVTAIIVVANGTVPGLTVGTRHALSTLSAILPKPPVSNIAVVLTNVSSPLDQNFAQNGVPDLLKGAPLFPLNNPVALQKKYLERKDVPIVKKGGAKLCNAVQADEKNAMEVVVELFDWLDGLEPKSSTEGASPPDEPQTSMASATDLPTPMNQAPAKRSPGITSVASGVRRLSSL